jgi:hypothetical protein
MQTAGATELGYASRAIISLLMKELVTSNIISASTAFDILAKSVVSLQSAGNLVWVPGAVAVVGDIRSDLAKQGIK